MLVNSPCTRRRHPKSYRTVWRINGSNLKKHKTRHFGPGAYMRHSLRHKLIDTVSLDSSLRPRRQGFSGNRMQWEHRQNKICSGLFRGFTNSETH